MLEATDLAPQLSAREALVASHSKRREHLSIKQIRHELVPSVNHRPDSESDGFVKRGPLSIDIPKAINKMAPMAQGEDVKPGSIGRDQRIALAVSGLVLALAAMAAILLSSSSSSGENGYLTGSAFPNVDPANTRFFEGPIQATTVSDLTPAWTLPLENQALADVYSSSPVIANGVVYFQDSASNVQAIDLKTGEVIWETRYDSPVQGANGVVVANDRVYGATATSAFALDQKTGEEIWSVRLTRNEFEGIDMAPGYHDGLVYVSTLPIAFQGGSVGVLWALHADTGQKVWNFDTVPRSLWGNPRVNFGGGLATSGV